MGYWKIKPNMHGTGGGRWGTREEAKRAANKVRRHDDAAEVRAPDEGGPDMGPSVDWLKLSREERKAVEADELGNVE
jgi:hypothetical protein